MLKRTNWTNEEVIKILEGFMLDFSKNKKTSDERLAYLEIYNEGLQDAVHMFYDFMRDPIESYGAAAYNTEDDTIVVISKPLPR